MRYLDIPMSKAAKGRLSLLKDIPALPIPLDPALHAPFGLRWAEQTLCLTYEGSDVAYVPEKMRDTGSAFSLNVLVGPSDTIDLAFQRAFANLTRILDRNGSAIAAQKRDEAERRAEEKREKAANPGPIAYFLKDAHTIPSRDLGTLSEKDIEILLRFPMHQDPLALEKSGYEVIQFRHDGKSATMRRDGTQYALVHDHIGLDTAKVRVEILRRIEKNRRLSDAAYVIEGLRALPPARFSIQRFQMQNSTNYDRESYEDMIFFGQDMALRLTGFSASVLREGHVLLEIRVFSHKAQNSHWIPKDAGDCLNYRNRQDKSGFTGDVMKGIDVQTLDAIASLWLEALAKNLDHIDLAFCAFPDENRLLAEAERMDMGYF